MESAGAIGLTGRPASGAAVESLGRWRERRLLAKARGGSEAALEELFRAHWPRAYRSALMIVRDRQIAEDVAQEAFLAAIRSLDRFDLARPFGPWLNRIVANRAIDHARARAIRAEVPELPGLEPVAREPLPDAVHFSDELHDAVLGLDLEQRTCVVLRYVLDWSPGEISRFLGLPRGTVNSRLRRALDRLAEAIEAES
ncbi:RNA polymerase sigma factor [Thermoleophilia bacterium SCSIO 60948]|nr:RNA polymerase sigma factor [Thermoleophilia bacterium SCSIO 60948]